MEAQEHPDEELMVRYCQGDTEAFEILFRRHRGRVYAWLRRRLGEDGLVDEVFQSSFLKLHQSRESYESSMPLLPWLFTIVRNTMLDGLRKSGRDLLQFEEQIERLAVAPEPEASTSGLAITAELDPAQREVVELRYLEELSFEEIAVRLKISEAGARQRLSRAIRRLRGLAGGPT